MSWDLLWVYMNKDTSARRPGYSLLPGYFVLQQGHDALNLKNKKSPEIKARCCFVSGRRIFGILLFTLEDSSRFVNLVWQFHPGRWPTFKEIEKWFLSSMERDWHLQNSHNFQQNSSSGLHVWLNKVSQVPNSDTEHQDTQQATETLENGHWLLVKKIETYKRVPPTCVRWSTSALYTETIHAVSRFISLVSGRLEGILKCDTKWKTWFPRQYHPEHKPVKQTEFFGDTST